MRAQEIIHMFSFTFEKSSAEIIEKAKAKSDQLARKVEERQERIRRLREEYGIDDGALVQLLTEARRATQRGGAQPNAYSYTSNARVASGGTIAEEKTVGAGVVNNLLTENDFIESEKDTIKRLGFIVRNLRDLPDRTITSLAPGVERPTCGHGLSYEELEFLGF